MILALTVMFELGGPNSILDPLDPKRSKTNGADEKVPKYLGSIARVPLESFFPSSVIAFDRKKIVFNLSSPLLLYFHPIIWNARPFPEAFWSCRMKTVRRNCPSDVDIDLFSEALSRLTSCERGCCGMQKGGQFPLESRGPPGGFHIFSKRVASVLSSFAV